MKPCKVLKMVLASSHANVNYKKNWISLNIKDV